MLMWSRVITEGPTFSRARRGDAEAQQRITQMIINGSLILQATPYFLPAAAVPDAEPAEDPLSAGVPTPVTVVFHDDPVAIGEGVEPVWAWVFVRRADSDLPHLAGSVICRSEEGEKVQLDHHVVSLVDGAASTVARRVLSSVQTGTWAPRKRLHLPGRPGSRQWKSKLGRSAKRERASGSLTDVRHLHTGGERG